MFFLFDQEARECETKGKQKMSSPILEEIFLQDRFYPDVEFYR